MRAATAHLVGTEAGRAELATGAGGDTTVEIDRLAESVALERLGRAAAAGDTFSILSEEVGHRGQGAEWPLVLIDPIDGSLNAKQGIPVFAVMLALLDGPRLADTRAGYVLNLVSGESWHAVRGAGAFRDGEPLRVLPPKPGHRDFEMVALESSPRSVARARPLLERAAKVRVLGCMALSIVHTATGGVDVFCAPFRARAFDMAASLLILREAGGVATDLEGSDVFAVRAGLEARTTLLCASDPGCHARALAALAEGAA